MQEALISLMQMAKTSAVIERLRLEGVPYVSVMTDPIYGGVSASWHCWVMSILPSPRRGPVLPARISLNRPSGRNCPRASSAANSCWITAP